MTEDSAERLAQAIELGLNQLGDAISRVSDGGELVGVEGAVSYAGKRIARAIAADAAPGRDAAGGSVESLTEAVMGVTAGLVQIADAIGRLADAVGAQHD